MVVMLKRDKNGAIYCSKLEPHSRDRLCTNWAERRVMKAHMMTLFLNLLYIEDIEDMNTHMVIHFLNGLYIKGMYLPKCKHVVLYWGWFLCSWITLISLTIKAKIANVNKDSTKKVFFSKLQNQEWHSCGSPKLSYQIKITWEYFGIAMLILTQRFGHNANNEASWAKRGLAKLPRLWVRITGWKIVQHWI